MAQKESKISSDRISNLPCNVIDCILTHLPLPDAARISVLSTFWRNKWLTIPHLIFEDWLFDNQHYRYDSIVSHVLLRHKGGITKFSLETEDEVGVDVYGIDIVGDWLQNLSNHSRIHHLKLDVLPEWGYVIPPSLFSFQHLTHLHLQGVEIKLPSTFAGFSRLVTLYLELIQNPLDVLKAFTSKCPMLKCLNAAYFYGKEFDCLDVVAPELEKFHFTGSFSSISLKCPRVKEVSLDFFHLGVLPIHDNLEWADSHERESNLVKVFSQMPLIEYVKLEHSHLLQFLAKGGVPQELPYKLSHLTRLEMFYVSLGYEEHVRILICLIKSSPNLKYLGISSHTKESMPTAIQYLKAQQKCGVLFHCLKSVTCDVAFDKESDMEFVKLLFLSATALEKLAVKLCKWSSYPDDSEVRLFERSWGSSEERTEIFQQLSSFLRP